ncbi:MAG: hypothetical protein V1820_03255 [archaeon]
MAAASNAKPSVRVEVFSSTRSQKSGNSWGPSEEENAEPIEIKVAKMDETLDRLSKGPILSSVEILERREDEKRAKAISELDAVKQRLKGLEERDSVTLEEIYASLKEVDKVKKAIFPYGEDNSDGLLNAQLKEIERKLGLILAHAAAQQEYAKSLDVRLSAIEGKMNSLESVVGRIDFPIDQLKNFFSMLLETNTQMKEFELDLLTTLKRVRKVELELRALEKGA